MAISQEPKGLQTWITLLLMKDGFIWHACCVQNMLLFCAGHSHPNVDDFGHRIDRAYFSVESYRIRRVWVELTFNHIATFTQSNASAPLTPPIMRTCLPSINYSTLHLLDQYCMLADNLLMVEIDLCCILINPLPTIQQWRSEGLINSSYPR